MIRLSDVDCLCLPENMLCQRLEISPIINELYTSNNLKHDQESELGTLLHRVQQNGNSNRSSHFGDQWLYHKFFKYIRVIQEPQKSTFSSIFEVGDRPFSKNFETIIDVL